jgi:hypothetical protein
MQKRLGFALLATALAVGIVGSVTSCGGSGGTTGPGESDVNQPFIRLVHVSPPDGSTLAVQMVHAKVEFGFPQVKYPLEAVIFWTPRDAAGRALGGRGCGIEKFRTFAPVQEYYCDFTITQAVYEIWRDNGARTVTLEFAVYHPREDGLADTLAIMEFPITYKLQ